MAAGQQDGKSSFTAPATSGDGRGHLWRGTRLGLARSARSCLLEKNVAGLTRYLQALCWVEGACPQSKNRQWVEIPMKCVYNIDRDAAADQHLIWIEFW